MQGFLKVEDLTDEEIVGAYVLTEDGRRYSNKKMGVKFQQQMVRELHARMNQFMQMKLPTMLKRVADIAESDIVEPDDCFLKLLCGWQNDKWQDARCSYYSADGSAL